MIMQHDISCQKNGDLSLKATTTNYRKLANTGNDFVLEGRGKGYTPYGKVSVYRGAVNAYNTYCQDERAKKRTKEQNIGIN